MMGTVIRHSLASLALPQRGWLTKRKYACFGGEEVENCRVCKRGQTRLNCTMTNDAMCSNSLCKPGLENELQMPNSTSKSMPCSTSPCNKTGAYMIGHLGSVTFRYTRYLKIFKIFCNIFRYLRYFLSETAVYI